MDSNRVGRKELPAVDSHSPLSIAPGSVALQPASSSDAAPVAPVLVTKPCVPPLEDFVAILEGVWDRRQLTNRGPLVQQLEVELADFLGVPYVSLVANATVGLMMALRHLNVTGEVITSPFSFVATGHAIAWSGARLTFADIDPVTLNLDPAAVERQITPDTRAILPVHCYGTPCDTSAFATLADRYGLSLIYDAAHAFGVRSGGCSLLNHGDLSVLSMHATKVFNTVEGGAIISHDPGTKAALDRLANCGIASESEIDSLGLNAKMSELHAAFGLSLLPGIASHIAARRAIAMRYWSSLKDLPGVRCVCPPNDFQDNFYAFPVLIGPDFPLSREALTSRLRRHGIHAKHYFQPLLADLPVYDAARGVEELPVARSVAREILCLPLYPELAPEEQDRVIDLLLQA